MFELTLEIDEIAERSLPDGGNSYGNSLAAREGRIDAPVRAAVTAGRALEQFARGRDRFAECRIGKRIAGIFEKQSGCIRPGPRRVQGSMAHLIEPIEWSRDENTGAARRAAKLADRHFETVPSLPQCSIVTFVCHLVNLKPNFSRFIWHAESTRSGHSAFTCRPFKRRRNSRNYSPLCINEPWRRALRSNRKKPNAPAANHSALSASASSIKSGRNTLSITSARMPSK